MRLGDAGGVVVRGGDEDDAAAGAVRYYDESQCVKEPGLDLESRTRFSVVSVLFRRR